MSSIVLANGAPGNASRILDEQVLAGVLECLRPKLELIARHRGIGDAEDIVQETLLAALIGFREGKFDRKSTIETWIYGILRNKIGGYYRSRSIESKYVCSLHDEAAETGIVRPLDSFAQPPEQELLVTVEQALLSLSARHWLVLMLNWHQGLKTREIAPLLRLSAGRTGAILAEAKRMFRQRVTGAEETIPRMRLIK